MRINVQRAIAALLFLPALAAWQVATAQMQLEPTSKLWVKGTSTVRAFECQAAGIEAKVSTAGTDAVAAVLAGEKGVSDVELTVPAAKLDCKNGKMNEHMLKALKATEHPTITFRIASYDLTKVDDSVTVTMKGTLLLGGVEKEIAVTGQAKQGPDGTLQIVGTHALNMKEFGLKPPSLMLGTMKVNEKLTVGFDLQLKN